MPESFPPLSFDRRRSRTASPIVRSCPECGKPLKARSEKQWEFVYYAHRTLSKRHRSPSEDKAR